MIRKDLVDVHLEVAPNSLHKLRMCSSQGGAVQGLAILMLHGPAVGRQTKGSSQRAAVKASIGTRHGRWPMGRTAGLWNPFHTIRVADKVNCWEKCPTDINVGRAVHTPLPVDIDLKQTRRCDEHSNSVA